MRERPSGRANARLSHRLEPIVHKAAPLMAADDEGLNHRAAITSIPALASSGTLDRRRTRGKKCSTPTGAHARPITAPLGAPAFAQALECAGCRMLAAPPANGEASCPQRKLSSRRATTLGLEALRPSKAKKTDTHQPLTRNDAHTLAPLRVQSVMRAQTPVRTRVEDKRGNQGAWKIPHAELLRYGCRASEWQRRGSRCYCTTRGTAAVLQY